jgi:hypothetical protein
MKEPNRGLEQLGIMLVKSQESFEEPDDIKAFLDEVMKESTGKTIII